MGGGTFWMMLVHDLQVLHGQTSIQSLILTGRGNIELCGELMHTYFDLGAMSHLTRLHVNTDGRAIHSHSSHHAPAEP